ncbi:GntR family transcriptional regulator [Janthinobacterium sp. 17J80-10]|uniref:GntR family transcriptional regulator n=1 Tax=Janthinobacterium sp. 17J80-10 TaxID=2497863 RepID=UPI001005658A|nr:GntR family transcriptional regulator [Janthinobacterium sp. 17J80-10]QAU33936.1 GntR family transcriptional regulator [Janthinobacterium sp. 17J80-10]
MNSFRAIEASPVPLYTQVKQSLRERIVDGTYAPHARLPAESEISRIFGVSRITVRQALGDLQNEGVIFKIPGKGTFVSKPKATQELTQLEGFAEAMSGKGYAVHNRVISHATVAATQHIAQQLEIAPGTQVTEIRRIRHLDSAPVSLDITYLPHAIGERLRQEDLAGRDIFLILEKDYGIALGHAELQIDALPADAHLALALQVKQGTALLRIERLTHGADGKPLDFEFLYFRGDAFQYRLQIARHGATQPLHPITGNAPAPTRK